MRITIHDPSHHKKQVCQNSNNTDIKKPRVMPTHLSDPLLPYPPPPLEGFPGRNGTSNQALKHRSAEGKLEICQTCLAGIFPFCANNALLVILDLDTTPGTSESERKTERTGVDITVPLLCTQTSV